MRRRAAHRAAAAAALALLVASASAAAAAAAARDFEHPASHDTAQQFTYGSVQRQDTPNDPHYDEAEPDTLNQRTSTSLYDERFDLFGFPSQLTPSAVYRDGPHRGRPMVAGFNASGAWKLERGRPDVTVAILDTGVKWDTPGLRDKVRLNAGELPLPEDAGGRTHPGAPLGGFDLNGNGVLDVDDYDGDPRVRGVMPPGERAPTAEDLIRAFGDCRIVRHAIVACVAGRHYDNDGNGYANDIAGWDFFDDTNDPLDRSSYFGATDHGTDRALQAVEQGNDGQNSIGVCPRCQFLPVRIWDSFVSDGNTFGLGIVYATDNGARVIEGANGSMSHSAFSEAASRYAYEHGVVQVYSGDDANTGDHNYPANYGHTMLIQGTVPDTYPPSTGTETGVPVVAPLLQSLGLHVPAPTQPPVTTFFRGANTTQYGGHSSISMTGPTGSDDTALAAGAAGLVVSAGRDAGIRLAPDETREILEQTAEPVTPGDTLGAGVGDPGAFGWTTHFGYGRANLGAAVALAESGRIPPQAAIDTPDWYAPETGRTVRITGLARARFARRHALRWTLAWGPGLAPDHWTTAATGTSTGTVTSFGTIDLDRVRAALAATPVPPDPGGPTFASGEPNPYHQQFTVRLTVRGAGVPTPGVDRRVVTAFTDPTLLHAYPERLGTGGQAPLRYADLRGDGVQELLVPGEDGVLRALLPDGRELPGWPVRTEVMAQAADHLTSPGLRVLPPAREELHGPAVADLFGDGRREVVDTAGRHVYAWDARGRLLPGFPVSSDMRFCGASQESQPLHHPKCGFFASPALGRLEGGSRPLDIVAPGLDGHLYAWQPDGRPVPGFPVALSDPSVPPAQRMVAEAITDPAIGDLTGSGSDDVVVATNESYPAAGPNPAAGTGQAISDLAASGDGGSSRLYAVDGHGRLLPGWPVRLNGALQSTFPFIGPGHDAEIMRLDGRPVVVASTIGGSLAEYDAQGHELRAMDQTSFGPRSDATDRSALINAFESASIGDLLGNGQPAIVKYQVSLGQVLNLLDVAQNFPYNHDIAAYGAADGRALPAWPAVTDDYQLLSSSDIARVVPGSRTSQVLAGTGLGLLHAYDGATGRDVAGFPKQTGGWLFTPPALASDGRLAAITREGFLFVWRTHAPACQTQWPTFRHDLRNTGDYDTPLPTCDRGAAKAPARVTGTSSRR